MTGLSAEILTSRIGRNSLGARWRSARSNHGAEMTRWLNKWIVPLLVAFVMLVTLAIAAFVTYGVHLLH
jgi:hypothetical protein